MEKARLKDPKHRAHEAMSQATKRFCPNCTQEYIKGDGCNKITCNKCNQLSCYLCGEKVNDYSHFCNHKLPLGVTQCPCGKACGLFTSTKAMEEIDRAKRQEAGRKVLVEAGITDEEEIVSILASPTKKKSSASNTAAPNNPPPQAALNPPQPPVAAGNVNQRVAPIERNQPRNQNALNQVVIDGAAAPDRAHAQPAAANLNPQAPPFQFQVPQVVNPQPAARNLNPPFMFGQPAHHQVRDLNAFHQQMEALNQRIQQIQRDTARLQRDNIRRLREARVRTQQQLRRR